MQSIKQTPVKYTKDFIKFSRLQVFTHTSSAQYNKKKYFATPPRNATIMLIPIHTQNYTLFYFKMLSVGAISSSTNGMMRTMLQYSQENIQWPIVKAPTYRQKYKAFMISHKLKFGCPNLSGQYGANTAERISATLESNNIIVILMNYF